MNDVQCNDSPIIRVDRSTPLEYPDWVNHFINSGLENLGPVEFDVRSLVQEYPNGLGLESLILATDILAELEKNKKRERCLGLREAEAVKRKGIKFFREYFNGEAVICWKCIACACNGSKYVPFIYELPAGVAVAWLPLYLRRTVVNKLVYFPE